MQNMQFGCLLHRLEQAWQGLQAIQRHPWPCGALAPADGKMIGVQLTDVLLETYSIHVCMHMSALALMACHRLVLLVWRLHSPHLVCNSWLMHQLGSPGSVCQGVRGYNTTPQLLPSSSPSSLRLCNPAATSGSSVMTSCGSGGGSHCSTAAPSARDQDTNSTGLHNSQHINNVLSCHNTTQYWLAALLLWRHDLQPGDSPLGIWRRALQCHPGASRWCLACTQTPCTRTTPEEHNRAHDT
jgi:hypothetical protein